ncbi:uncharacterized protein [Penaeus vannamei]|uniref:uncharacterized protein n=1 Tax=Penaeus vannamei TaxID=6689 RepID=UPI00387F72A4
MARFRSENKKSMERLSSQVFNRATAATALHASQSRLLRQCYSSFEDAAMRITCSLVVLASYATWMTRADPPPTPPTRTCGGDYRGPSGAFVSPHYPSRYPNNKECIYTFNTGSPIVITCPDFSLQKEKNGKCGRDSVTIKDYGQDTKYCGNAGPSDYHSVGSNVTVVFKSNGRVRKTGFYCLYESRPGATTSTTTTSTSTTTTTPRPLSQLYINALTLYEKRICKTTPKPSCGCAQTAESEFYSTVSDNYRVIVTNGVPGHVYVTSVDSPDHQQACPHEVFMAVPAKPIKGRAYLPYGQGVVGIAVSGGFFYNHYSFINNDAADLYEVERSDVCNGHSDRYCRYHYNLIPTCVAGAGTCAMVGYMLDGFPVYMYCNHDTENRPLTSCYQLNGRGDGTLRSHYTFNETAFYTGNCDLDRANGYRFPDVRGYAYILSEDYPFVMAGHYGTELGSLCYVDEMLY